MPISLDAISQLYQSDLRPNEQDPSHRLLHWEVTQVYMRFGFDAWVEFTQCSPAFTVRPIKITSSIDDLHIQPLTPQSNQGCHVWWLRLRTEQTEETALPMVECACHSRSCAVSNTDMETHMETENLSIYFLNENITA